MSIMQSADFSESHINVKMKYGRDLECNTNFFDYSMQVYFFTD